MAVVLAERRRRERERRLTQARRLEDELRRYAGEHGGCFVLFGSYVTERFRHDSDIDILVDFPSDRVVEALDFAEAAGRRLGLALDLIDGTLCRPDVRARLRAQGKTLP